jgi:hypothetical protein
VDREPEEGKGEVMRINHLWRSNISQFRKGIIVGAVIAMIISILHSQTFRHDVWGLSDLIVWYLLSLFVGSASGFAGCLLLSVIPSRLPSVVEYGVVVILGLLGYLIQVYLFLRIAFKMISWE